jgi:cell wall-associated NlpC family hydrolase
MKLELRRAIILEASKLLGIPYEFGAEWKDYSSTPKTLDCSELVEGVYHIVGLQLSDGSQNQFDETLTAMNPLPGDLAFFGRGGRPDRIYHVGIIYDEKTIIEARGFDPSASFETGKVILRPIERWKAYKNFVGFRVHPRLC